MSRHKRSVERQCLFCGKIFMTYPKGDETAKYCSRSCASKNQPPEARKKRADKARKPYVEKICPECGRTYFLKPMGQSAINQIFCSPSCSVRHRWKDPEYKSSFSAKLKISAGVKLRGRPQPYSAERMRKYNPMSNPETVEKVKQAMKGRTFLSRGGNGTFTRQQQVLCQALELPETAMEFVIPTAQAKEHFQSLPPAYKVDLGIPAVKLAIEVDGRTHTSRKWKFLDRRKTAVLNFLGWTVLRFWNKEVDQDLNGCVQTTLFTISKLKETTTTLPTESWSITAMNSRPKRQIGELPFINWWLPQNTP